MDSITQDKFACGAMYKHKVVDNQDLQTIGVNIFFFFLLYKEETSVLLGSQTINING